MSITFRSTFYIQFTKNIDKFVDGSFSLTFTSLFGALKLAFPIPCNLVLTVMGIDDVQVKEIQLYYKDGQ